MGTYNANRFTAKNLKVASRKIFLAQLNKVNPASSCLGDLLEQRTLARVLVSGELGAIGNVVKQQAFYGFVFAISGTRSPFRFGSGPR